MGAPDLRPPAVVAAVVTVLGATGAVPVWPGTPHHVALPPLDLFADVRVLLAEAPSYPAFVAGLVAAVAARSVALAAVLGALHRAGVVRAARFYGLAVPVALVAGGLAYSGVAAVYSPFLWVGVAIAVVALVVAGPRPWRAPNGRHGVPGTLAYLAALLVVSLLSSLGGAGARLGLVWVSAALTAVAIRWLRRPGAPARPGRAPAPLLVAAVAVAGTAAVATATVPAPLPAATPPAATQAAGTLFVVPGIGGSSGTSTMFRLDPAALAYGCGATAYFSYAGPGPGAPRRDARCPIRSGAPYRPEHTRRPLQELVASFRDQYARLDPPVVVVAHSQGGWVAAAALGPGPPVAPPAAVVLLGAFPGHRTAYRLDGGGPGVVGTDLLEALTAVLRRLRGTTFDPRAPLARDLLATPGAVEGATRDAIAGGVRVVTVTSALDLPVMAGDRHLPGAEELCPLYVHHGHLPRSDEALAGVRRALASPEERGCEWWRRWPAQAFSAFAVPSRVPRGAGAVTPRRRDRSSARPG